MRRELAQMFIQLFTVAVLTLLVSTKASAQGCSDADATALAWIEKMSSSIHQDSYQGVVTLQRDNAMQVMQISHIVGEGTSSERLTELTGQGAEVQRNGHPLDCVHPGHQLLQLGADLQAGKCGITQHYQFSVTDGERVAGRKSVRIRIEPRDMYRFGYVMSLDRKTGLLLKTEMIGQGNRSLEKFQFANISYSNEVRTLGEADVVHQAEHPHPGHVAAGRSLAQAWQVRWVPRGFIATDTASGSAARRTFTDGLAVFSVFLEDLDREMRPGEGLVRRGGTTSYTRGMQLGEQPVLVTVLGEVPVNTARMVADSIAWVR